MPIRDEHCFDVALGRQVFSYPEFRSRFLKYKVPAEIENSGKPLLIIHNKYSIEWDSCPVNYIPLTTLKSLFVGLMNTFTIGYIRHSGASAPGYSNAHNTQLAFDDGELLDHFPNILRFEQLYNSDLSYDLNTFKNAFTAAATILSLRRAVARIT
jgi:hypothetical protein